jgi:hypothetical protein
MSSPHDTPAPATRSRMIHHWVQPIPGPLPRRQGVFARLRFRFWIALSSAILLLWARTELGFLLWLGKWCLSRAFAPEHGMIPILKSDALHKLDSSL